MKLIAHSTEIIVSYSQIAVFNANEDQPFLDWTDDEINQGFAWNEGNNVGFSTMEDARCRVEIVLGEGEPQADGDALRCICVPFQVDAASRIAISSIVSQTVTAAIPEGRYGLTFNIIPLAPYAASASLNQDEGESDWLYRFVFYPGYEGGGVILRQDEELDPPRPLVMSASRA